MTIMAVMTTAPNTIEFWYSSSLNETAALMPKSPRRPTTHEEHAAVAKSPPIRDANIPVLALPSVGATEALHARQHFQFSNCSTTTRPKRQERKRRIRTSVHLMMDHWSLRLLPGTPKTGMEKNTAKESTAMQTKIAFLRFVLRERRMPMRTSSMRGGMDLRVEESFCLLLREPPDVHGLAVPNDGGNRFHVVALRRIAALIAFATVLDDLAAASLLFDGGVQRLESCPTQRTAGGDDLEGGHKNGG